MLRDEILILPIIFWSGKKSFAFLLTARPPKRQFSATQPIFITATLPNFNYIAKHAIQALLRIWIFWISNFDFGVCRTMFVSSSFLFYLLILVASLSPFWRPPDFEISIQKLWQFPYSSGEIRSILKTDVGFYRRQLGTSQRRLCISCSEIFTWLLRHDNSFNVSVKPQNAPKSAIE